MGATGVYFIPSNVRQFLDDDISYHYADDSYGKVIASMMYGSTYYAAFEMVDPIKDRQVIGVVITTKKSNGEFIYKDMTETMGPYYYNCSEKILDLLTPTTNEYALKWREACRKVVERKKDAIKLKDGDIIRFESPLNYSVGKFDEFLVSKKDGKTRYYARENGRNVFLCSIPNIKNREFLVL